MRTETRKILGLLERGVIDAADAAQLFLALRGCPLAPPGAGARPGAPREDPRVNRAVARHLLQQVS